MAATKGKPNEHLIVATESECFGSYRIACPLQESQVTDITPSGWMRLLNCIQSFEEHVKTPFAISLCLTAFIRSYV